MSGTFGVKTICNRYIRQTQYTKCVVDDKNQLSNMASNRAAATFPCFSSGSTGSEQQLIMGCLCGAGLYFDNGN